MVFVPSISTFYISQKLGGPSTLLIGDVIEQSYNASNYHLTAALSFVLMIILLIGLAIMNKYTDDDSGGMMI
jgi:spermidine/putrescine transport system permease protein